MITCQRLICWQDSTDLSSIGFVDLHCFNVPASTFINQFSVGWMLLVANKRSAKMQYLLLKPQQVCLTVQRVSLAICQPDGGSKFQSHVTSAVIMSQVLHDCDDKRNLARRFDLILHVCST